MSKRTVSAIQNAGGRSPVSLRSVDVVLG